MELNTINSLLTGMKNLFIGKNSIVQNTEISDTTKIPSSVVTKNLQGQITQLNSDLSKKANTSHNHNCLIGYVTHGHFLAHPSDHLVGQVTYTSVCFRGVDGEYDPQTGEEGDKWYNVLTFGVPARCTQIAVQTFIVPQAPVNGQIWIRIQHDTRVSSWFCIAKPEIPL